jgi:hypothetical protein
MLFHNNVFVSMVLNYLRNQHNTSFPLKERILQNAYDTI